jgi:short subunit dehydrogenase-like uncharacterized protein
MAQFRPSWLLYGANGYTAKLIAARAKAKGFEPILAGRNLPAVEATAAPMGLKSRIFDVTNYAATDKALMGVKLVLNCAGPFDQTAAPLASACIRNSVHYLDIAGEVQTIRQVQRLDERAREERVLLLSGVGFGCLPSEALLAYIKKQRPGVLRAQLALAVDGNPSKGTMTSMAQSLKLPGYRLDRGQLVAAKPGESKMSFDFGPGGKRKAGLNPWRGDLFTAQLGLGFNHLDCYMTFPWMAYQIFRNPNILEGEGLLGKLYQWFSKRGGDGPNEGDLQKHKSYIYAQGMDEDGRKTGGVLACPNAYAATASCALYAVDYVLKNKVPDGFSTCGALFGDAPLTALEGFQFTPFGERQ